MRDPDRIDRMIGMLCRIWHAAPDQRLGQLVTNLLEIDGSGEVWNVEDDVAERKLLAADRIGFAAARETK